MKKLILLAALGVASLLSAKNDFKIPATPVVCIFENRDYLGKLNLSEISVNEKSFVIESLNKQENYSEIVATNIYKVNKSENYIILMRNRVLNLKIDKALKSIEVIKDISISNSLNNEGNGNIILIDNINKNSLLTNFENGKIIDKNFFSPVWFCQREKKETFTQCFTRETNEFCDDFISTVAYITNDSIPLLIAATCTC